MCSPPCVNKTASLLTSIRIARQAFFCLAALLLFMPACAHARQEAIVSLYLNEQYTSEVFILIQDDGDVLVSREDIDKSGLLKEGLGISIDVDGVPHVSLRSIEGLVFTIDMNSASLRATAPTSVFREQSLDSTFQKGRTGQPSVDKSAFLNYALYFETESDSFYMPTELGLRMGKYFLYSTANYSSASLNSKLTRLQTSIRTDDRKNMRTTWYGDVSATSGIMGAQLFLGGMSISKNFSIEPYFIRYPSLDIGATLETPSTVRVYVNDQIITERELSPGPFSLDDIPAQIGPGISRIVIRDAFGREREVREDFYFSDRLLKKGLHEYSLSLGAIREDYTVRSDSYSDPAFIGFHRYGVSDTLKAGYAFELSSETNNIGAEGAYLLGKAGVLEAAGRYSATSTGGLSGYGLFGGYHYNGKKFGISLSHTHTSKDYLNVGDDPAKERPTVLRSAISFRTRDLGSASLSYLKIQGRTEPGQTRTTLSYTKGLGRRATFMIVASHSEIELAADNDEIMAKLIYTFDNDYSGSLSTTNSDQSGRVTELQALKATPASGGFGIRGRAGSSEIDGSFSDIEAEYLTNIGSYRVRHEDVRDTSGMSYSAVGGIGYIDGSLFMSRTITDGFAKVRAGGLEGVGVKYYGGVIGKTDKKGEFILPQVKSFENNMISLDSRDMPINYHASSLTRYVSPKYRSGAVVDFGVREIKAYMGKVFVIRVGIKTPAEFTSIKVVTNEGTVQGLVGKAGEFYIENLPEGTHSVTMKYKWKLYEFTLSIGKSDEVLVDLGEFTANQIQDDSSQ